MTSKVHSVLLFIRRVPICIIKSILSILLTASLISLSLALWMLNEFVRRAIITPLLKSHSGGKIKLVMDGADNIFSFKKFGNSRNILILTIYKDKIDPNIYAQRFLDKVINYKGDNGQRPFHKLKSIYTKQFGYFCWKDMENFDINNHVKIFKHDGQDENENSKFSFKINNQEDYHNDDDESVVTESGLMNILSGLAIDMDESRPQWEEVIVPRFVYDHEVEEDGGHFKVTAGTKVKSARIFRCHHSYMDGASFLLMTSNCMMDEEFPYTGDPTAPSRMSKIEQVFHFISCVLFGFTSLFRTILMAATVDNRFVTRKFSGKFHHTWSQPINLSLLKEIRSKTKCSLPALLSCVTGSVIVKFDKEYPCQKEKLNEEYQEQQQCFPTCQKSDKKKLLVGLIGAVIPYPNISPRNRYTVVNFHIPTTSISRLQRLELMTEKIKKLARGQDYLVNLWMFQFFGKFPAFFVQAMMKNGGSPIIISNTPWATRRVKLLGDEVEEIGGWVPLLAFSGLGLLITRYCDTIRFCAVAEDACLSKEQLDFIVSEISHDIHLLAQECVVAQQSLPSTTSIPV